MFANRMSKMTVALAVLVVVAALAVQAAVARPIVKPRPWTNDPWCFQTGEHYQLCAHGR